MEKIRKTSLGINTAIINVLQKYNKKVPIDFVARTIGRRPLEIQAYVKRLERKGIIERDGDDIFIVEQEGPES